VMYELTCIFFFFSSRRRHTRSKRDWSSDVCSSDLATSRRRSLISTARSSFMWPPTSASTPRAHAPSSAWSITSWARARMIAARRSEERRVGKEGRGGGAADDVEKESQQER